MIKSSRYQYIRSIVFCKAKLNGSSLLDPAELIEQYCETEDGLNMPVASFAALGTYDSIFSQHIEYNYERCDYSYELTNNPLRQIARTNRRITQMLHGTNYSNRFETMHPTYIVDSCASRKEAFIKHSEFWAEFEDDRITEASANFFMVSNVYMRGNDLKKKYGNSCYGNGGLKGKLEEKLDEFKRDARILKSSPTFDFRIYNSLDIADCIVVWKSKNVKHIMDVINKLLSDNSLEIAYCYTVCALPWKRLANKDWNSDDIIVPLVAVRAVTGNNTIDASGYFKTLEPFKATPYFYYNLGLEDFWAAFQDVPVSALYGFINNIVNSDKNRIVRLNTQIGLDVNEGHSFTHEKNDFDRILELICDKLKRSYDELFIDYKAFFVHQIWWEQLYSLVSAISSHISTYEFDEIAFLTLNSLAFFYHWLLLMLSSTNSSDCLVNYNENIEQLFMPHKKNINLFLLSLERFIDQIVRSDSIVSQEPNVDMPNLNMSTRVIEFCGAFFGGVCEYLMRLDATKEEDNSYFLVPSLCRSIKTMPLFTRSQREKSLYFIELPYKSIHDPYVICASLTHEAAHFFGESLRNRDLRFFAFECCICTAFAYALGIAHKDVLKNMVDDVDERVKRFLNRTNRLTDGIESPRTELFEDGYYLSDLSEAAKHALISIAFSDNFHSEIIKRFAGDRNLSKIEARLHKYKANALVPSNKRDRIEQITKDTAMFFKECYADLVMLDLLRLEFRGYFYVISDAFKVIRHPAPESLSNTGLSNYYRLSLVLQRILLVSYVFDLHNDYIKIDSSCNNHEYAPKAFIVKIQESDSYYEDGYRPVAKYRRKVLKLLRETANEYYDAINKLRLGKRVPTVYQGFYPYHYHLQIINFLEVCMNDLKKAKSNSIHSDELNAILGRLTSAFDEYACDRILFGDNRLELLNINRQKIIGQMERMFC